MQPPLLSIDKNYDALKDAQVTAKVIDGYICTMSLNLLDFPKNREHILELITHNPVYWERLVKNASQLYWLRNENFGIAIYLPNQDCGFTRTYRFSPLKGHTPPQKKISPNAANWKHVKSEIELLDILGNIEHTAIFNSWKNHKIKTNKPLTGLAEGRVANTTVGKAFLVSKGNGCAVCGQAAVHHATTTLSEQNTVMVSISLCETHRFEAISHPCILQFFAALFFLMLDIPDLVKLEKIPDELIVPIAEIVASNLNAEHENPEKRARGWHIKFKMKDEWSWLLRLNTLNDYAYILCDPSGKILHKIDSANHHPDIPFGPDHQHFNPKTRRESIQPSFSYGIPLFDFPLLKKSKLHHERMTLQQR